MDNWKNFCKLVDKMLENNSAYENEVNIFKKYLKSKNLDNIVFNLNVTDIDNYFEYCFEKNKIGSSSALIAHFSALKMLFNFLEENNINFKNLHGYINLDTTIEKYKERFNDSLKTAIIDKDLLTKILSSLDLYIETNIDKKIEKTNAKKRFLNVLIARLFIKMSLLIPLKISEIINLEIYDIRNESSRTIEHNKIIIKIPNGMRIQILQTISYIESHCELIYQGDKKLFEFLLSALDLKFTPSSITPILNRTYEEIEIQEMQEKKEGTVRDRNIYTPESYKTTAILNMLKNGTDILALKQLTGLDFTALIKNYDLDIKINDNDIKSTEINCGICKCEYFTYL